ncbi:PSD1 and planctomycete cytochrome C domain-containing protein [Lignipirellula cremea]|uniref:Planctomycete cytochrome C n=1 Tax=Lignipirellula cremea TaxID=2528010 RepID=A0A518DRT9_9BACT|nr:PSD1 and planctomycete cytochrome C domain-containing protein [Lignipirellula cremea]QDU94558.1 Planctomycete cytochrome C [Lignipirellula cremea]
MKTALLPCFVLLLALGSRVLAAEDDALSYNRDVRPLLSGKCFTCHGPDENAREADLRLDLRADAVAPRDGVPAITPGDPAASSLLERITSGDPDLRMPPAEAGEPLTAAQIAVLRKWIQQGAKYERHWSFEPIVRQPPPAVRDRDQVENGIDHFVLARLEKEGLKLSPPADRATLVRRLYLDLLGLLPPPAEVAAYQHDARPDAYERLVDRILASPRYGERWGRHWLDQARYADSHGYTNDNERSMWPYRDWVLRAVNRDLPFDRFTTLQLAGDLLPETSLDQQIATGFHRNTLINTEGGTKADQFRDEQVKDRVDTTGDVWLGLTVGCAKCHTHKFDPISQHEYYRLYAFFNSTADSNSTPPVVNAPTQSQQTQLAALTARLAQLQQQLDADSTRAERQQAWETNLQTLAAATNDEANADSGPQWKTLELDGKSNAGAVFTVQPDKSLLVSGENDIADFYELTAASPLTTIRSVRLEVLTDDDLPKTGPGRAANGNFVLAEFWFRTGDGRELRFSKAQADHSQPKFAVAGLIDNNNDTGWAVNGSPEGGPNHNRTAWFNLPTPLEVEADHALTFNLQHHAGAAPYNVGRLRISVSSEPWVDLPSPQVLAELAATPADKRTPAIQKRLDEAFLRTDAALAPVFAAWEQTGQALEKLNGQISTTMVMRELEKARPTQVQHRGDFLQPGDPVSPDVPAVLPPLKVSHDSQETESQPAVPLSRMDLAKWLVRDDNPLTPRVRVNRLWMHLFGRGLVETDNDFGAQGSAPSHPVLLDWLAAEHRQQGWSTKQLLRLIVCSAAYRQQSGSRPGAEELDPQNRLLWRQNRVRVEGEIVRDLALSASGLMSSKLGGPGVYPPQPDGVYAFTQRAKDWKTSEGEDRYRRGMYTFFYRSAPYPMLSTFDAPRFNQTCTRRDRSNTPLQSLTVANDASLFELTQALARRVVREAPQASVAARCEQLFRICLARPPAPAEAQRLAAFFLQQEQYFADHPEQAVQAAGDDWPSATEPAAAAAWVAAARVVLNLDEFITRE